MYCTVRSGLPSLKKIKMKKIVLLTVACILVNMSSALAWGNKGHKIVAKLAKVYLNKGVADSVQYYLGETSFEDASVWMDEVRSDHAYDYLKPMHYVNVEKDKTYVTVSDPNIINELDRVMKALQNRKGMAKEEVKKNIMELFHLVGDLHQPLHAGYSGDKGGNAVEVDFLGYQSNLHKVWDTNIIEEQKITVDNCTAYVNTLSVKDKSAIQEINTITWLNDSRELLGAAYAFKNNTIDQNYVVNNTPVVEKQLSKAGLRLAGTLNQLFGAEGKINSAKQ